jgi:hypothetical protein
MSRKFADDVELPNRDPSSGNYAARKAYVDALVADAVNITTGTLSAQRLPKVLSPINVSTEAGPNVQLTNTSWNYKNMTATGNLNFLAPTTNDERQILQVAVLASGGGRTITFETGIAIQKGGTRSFVLASGELLRFSLEYSSLLAKWVLTAVGIYGP